MSAPRTARVGFAPRLAAFYVAIFILLGIHLPFFPLWLEAKGFGAGMIGLVLAIPMIVRVAAIPYAARQADRRDALRAAIILTTTATVIAYALVGLAGGVLAIIAAFVLASAVYTPIMPLADAYALKGLAALGRAYGPVRLWGSAAFILGTFVAGAAIDLISTGHLIWLIVAACALSAMVALTLSPLAPSAPVGPDTARGESEFFRSGAFFAVLAAASLSQSSHAVYYAFSALEWTAAGLDGTAVAGLWALGVIAEIVLFAFSGRLPEFLMRPSVLLIIGASGGAVRWTAMALDPPVLLLPWLQLLHALSFGATHLGALSYLARNAPAGQAATAQGYHAVALGLAMAASMGISGLLFAAYGGLAYAAMALASIAGGACAVIAHRLARIARA